MECDETEEKVNYCRYTYPNQLLKDIGIQDCTIVNATNATLNCDDLMYENQKRDFAKVIIALIIFIIVFRLIAFFIMRYRLKH